MLISEIKDSNGVRIVSGMKEAVDWANLCENINMDLDGGAKSTSVKFYMRTKAWLEKQPEYEG